MSDRPCVHCGAEVTSPVPETDFCRNCYYDGTHYSDEFASLLADLADCEGVTGAYCEHREGGLPTHRIFTLLVPKIPSDGGLCRRGFWTMLREGN